MSRAFGRPLGILEVSIVYTTTSQLLLCLYSQAMMFRLCLTSLHRCCAVAVLTVYVQAIGKYIYYMYIYAYQSQLARGR